MNKVKDRVPQHYAFQKEIKEQADKIKDYLSERGCGVLLENQVEICSKTALQNIGTAFKEIDAEEQVNPNSKKLTSL